MKKIFFIIIAILFMGVGFGGSLLLDHRAGGSTALAQSGENWVVRIDDTVITREEFEREFNVHLLTLPLSEEQKEQYRQKQENKKKFLANLINEYLIYQEAVSKGYLKKDMVKDLIKVVSRRAVNEIYLSEVIEPLMQEVPDEQIEVIYNNNKKMFSGVDIDVARQQIKMQLFQQQYREHLNQIIDDLKGEAKVIRNDNIAL
ncbi:MAG: SurA N-terminal domain-containing protein [Spirochaetota bacterium]